MLPQNRNKTFNNINGNEKWTYKAKTAYVARFLRKAPIINQTDRRWSELVDRIIGYDNKDDICEKLQIAIWLIKIYVLSFYMHIFVI